jgi:sugar phosphate isomerase/epimerase
VVELAGALGFDAVEWGVGPDQAVESASSARTLRQLCDVAGLSCCGVSVQRPDVTLGTPRRAAPYVRLAAELGAPFLRLFAPPCQSGGFARAQRRARAGVDALVATSAGTGVAVLVETSPATLAPSPELAATLVEHHPPSHAGVLYDPGNTVIEGFLEPRLAMARLGAHLRHVHVKNIAWSQRGRRWRWSYAALSEGQVDWRETFAVLAAGRYRGRFSIDHLPGAPLRRLLESETETLRRLLAGATSRAR